MIFLKRNNKPDKGHPVTNRIPAGEIVRLISVELQYIGSSYPCSVSVLRSKQIPKIPLRQLFADLDGFDYIGSTK